MGQHILPVEIFGMIFEFATACTEEWQFGMWERYRTLWSHPSGLDNTINQWEDAVKTRRSLVAVSRSFNRLTIPLLYQSFFPNTSRQVSLFRSALQTRPTLGEYIKRLSLSLPLQRHIIIDFMPILRFCPNIVFYDAELSPSGLKPAPSLRSLELIYPQGFNDRPMEPMFHLLASILQATPQLEHLGLYQLPSRGNMTNSQPFVSIRLEYLRSLHLRIHPPSYLFSAGIIPTVPLFFSLTLPRLEDLVLQGWGRDEGVLKCIPILWLQHIRQFNATHESIASCRLDSNHFHRLRKLTLDFSLASFDPSGNLASFDPSGNLDEKFPFSQLEEIELVGCATPIRLRQCRTFEALYSVFCLCADDTATPKLRSLSTDITESANMDRVLPPPVLKTRINELHSVVKRILVRGVDPKGLDSSSLQLNLQELIYRLGDK